MANMKLEIHQHQVLKQKKDIVGKCGLRKRFTTASLGRQLRAMNKKGFTERAVII
jgi:hypothetical protein